MDLGISDHSAISLRLSWRKPKPPSNLVQHRSFKKFDSEKFNRDLSEAPWTVLVIFDNIDDKLDYFNEIFVQILNKHAPYKRLELRRMVLLGSLETSVNKWITDINYFGASEHLGLKVIFNSTGDSVTW